MDTNADTITAKQFYVVTLDDNADTLVIECGDHRERAEAVARQYRRKGRPATVTTL